MKVLEEFWYGNINPMERPFQSQRKFDKAFRLLTKNEEELLKNLNEQEKELFDKVKVCHPSKNRHKKAPKNEMNRSISLIYANRPHLFHGLLDNEPLPV